MKLSRILYHQTQHGKNAVRRMIAAGEVRVNHSVVKDSRLDVGEFDLVELADEVIQNRTAIYIMLHKPAGFLSATSDPEHPTVMELIDIAETLHIAGRLDRASTGLLLLTNDGQWSRALTEPKEGIPKTYLVTTAEEITPKTAVFFKQGIYFAYEDLTTQPAELEILGDRAARITIYEGRYHQIKRMFHAVGNRVTSLHRESVGHLTLDPQLAAGEYRQLSRVEAAIPTSPT